MAPLLRRLDPLRRPTIRPTSRTGSSVSEWPLAIRTLLRHDALCAALVAAAASAVPSTIWTLVKGGDLLEGARAAGALLLGGKTRPPVLVAAAVPVHLTLSMLWAAALSKVLPRRREPMWGMAGGLAIAALDLGLIGRRLPSIRALEQPPQWADHIAFGLAVGLVVRGRRRRS